MNLLPIYYIFFEREFIIYFTFFSPPLISLSRARGVYHVILLIYYIYIYIYIHLLKGLRRPVAGVVDVRKTTTRGGGWDAVPRGRCAPGWDWRATTAEDWIVPFDLCQQPYVYIHQHVRLHGYCERAAADVCPVFVARVYRTSTHLPSQRQHAAAALAAVDDSSSPRSPPPMVKRERKATGTKTPRGIFA